MSSEALGGHSGWSAIRCHLLQAIGSPRRPCVPGTGPHVHNQLCPGEPKHYKLQCFWALTPQKPCNSQCLKHVKHEHPDYFFFDPPIFFFDPELPGGPRGRPRGAQGGPGSPGFQGVPVSPINRDQNKNSHLLAQKCIFSYKCRPFVSSIFFLIPPQTLDALTIFF